MHNRFSESTLQTFLTLATQDNSEWESGTTEQEGEWESYMASKQLTEGEKMGNGAAIAQVTASLVYIIQRDADKQCVTQRASHLQN